MTLAHRLDLGHTPDVLRAELEAAIASAPRPTLRDMADALGDLGWTESGTTLYAVGYAGTERWACHLGRTQPAVCVVTLGQARPGGQTFARLFLAGADREAIVRWLCTGRQARRAAEALRERLVEEGRR